MITYRVQVTLNDTVTNEQVLEAFCNWRIEAKHADKEQKQWCSEIKHTLKNQTKEFHYANGTFRTIKIFYNLRVESLAIQFIENEGNRTFISTIISNTLSEHKMLSFTLEEINNNEEQQRKTHQFHKPQFFKYIESQFNLDGVSLDGSGLPKSSIPTIYVKPSISTSQIEVLGEMFNHTANIRYGRIDKEHDRKNADKIAYEKLSTDYPIIDVMHFNQLEERCSWNYVLDHSPSVFQIIREKLFK